MKIQNIDKIFDNAFVFDPYTPKEETYQERVNCNYPGCHNCAINSHIAQRRRFLTRIAEDNKVLQLGDEQLQFQIDNNQPYSILSINNALSLPVFCDYHDGKLFRQIEKQEPDLSDINTLLLLSYRAECGVYEQEYRRQLYYQTNPRYNPFCQGPLFDLQKEYSCFVLKLLHNDITTLYNDRKSAVIDKYEFVYFEMPNKLLCMSDVVFLESEFLDIFDDKRETSISPLYVHALPQQSGITQFVFGYRKETKTPFIDRVINSWKVEHQRNECLINLLVMANNWCVSPSYFGEHTDDICQWLMEQKWKFQQTNQLPFEI